MTVSQNGDIIIWIVPITNNSSYTDTNVSTTNVFSAGQEYVSHTVTKGSYNTGTSLWTTGDMQGLTTETLTVRTRVTDILSAPFTLTSTVTGDLNGGDPTPYVQTVLLDSCPATGAGIDDTSGCLCIDVSLNDTKCTKGVTTWELNIPSITNCTTYTWDEETGKGNFTPIDPTLPITGTYDLFCTSGMTVTQISCGVNFTITPQLEDKDIFDHTIAAVQYADLSVGDISVLTAQYPALTLADYCWNTIRNADGDLTSGIPVQCDESVDTRTFFSCTEDACIADLGECACSAVLPTDVTAGLPVDYEPQDGDTVYIQHPESTSIWVYDADNTRWERNACGCVYKISQAAGNLLTLNVLDNAPYISEDIILDATDEKVKVSANDTTSGYLLSKFVAGSGITLTENNNGANETITIASVGADACADINLTLTTVLGAPGNEAFLSVEGIDGTDPAWDEWEWQVADITTNPKVWVTVQTGGLDYTIATDDTTLRVKFVRTGCTYYSNVTGLPETLYDKANTIPFAEVYLASQVFVEGSGATKLDFATATITNTTSGKLSTSISNDNFVAVGAANTWEINYSGHLTFETAVVDQKVVIEVYVNGVLVTKSKLIVIVPTDEFEVPFSRSFITTIPAAQTVDLRFTAEVGDITAKDTVLSLKSLTFTT